MSCAKNVQRGAIAALKCGISRQANHVAFFAGSYLSVIKQQVTRPFRTRLHVPQAAKSQVRPAPRPLPVLQSIEQVRPLKPEQATGKKCTQCGNSAAESSGGAWYQLGAGQYCPHCAPQKAKGEHVALLPADSTLDDKPRAKRHTPRLTTLQPKTVSVGSVENIQGYAVRCLGRDTGLSLVPDVTVQAGQVKLDTSKWFIMYDKAGEAIGGPFANVKQAQAMASLLANFDWTRPPAHFTAAEVQQAGAMSRQQRGDLGFYQEREQAKKLEGLWRKT